jgi:hypothetical protein
MRITAKILCSRFLILVISLLFDRDFAAQRALHLDNGRPMSGLVGQLDGQAIEFHGKRLIPFRCVNSENAPQPR